jgi:tRNA (guanosine-2'-O-)-methyltransferase
MTGPGGASERAGRGQRRRQRREEAEAPAPRPLDPTGLKRLHRSWRRQTSGRLAVILDGVQNPFNIGTIIRHAAAFRVEVAWLVGEPGALDHPRVRKTAMGTDRYVDWRIVAAPADALREARAAGFQPIGIELTPDAEPLFALALSRDVALVVGHEERGLSRAALAGCDHFGFAPQLGKVGSLNVAAATAIALYEARRQEWTAGPTTGAVAESVDHGADHPGGPPAARRLPG